MTATSTTPTPVTAPAHSSSGAKTSQWREISRHWTDNAPLNNRSPREWGALLVLLVGTGVLYVWGLGASGYANDFYAAAVQAGTKSWKAFFFGSLDSNNVITVDKPPASLWPMEISGRIFGFSSWSMLVPQAIMGVLAVWLLYATVRRWFGPVAGLLAGLLLALTPVAVLMFRFNNPDAMMTLVIVAAAYCVTRAIEKASTKWLLLAGLVMGFSFLVKGLQPFTVLPALAIAYLVVAPASLRKRLLQLLGSAVAVVAGAGWWLLAVALTPASDRPYIGGSGDNSPLGLAFGYNGFGRITGDENGGGGGGGFSGATGVGRLFNSLNGGQIAWLLPAALIAVVALAILAGRAARNDRVRAAAIIWGGWLIVTGAVLSYASGTIHTYYTIELAPAIAALVAIGAVVLWRMRSLIGARVVLAAGIAVTAIWDKTLLDRATGWHTWVGVLVLVAAAVAVLGLLIPRGRAAVAAVVAGGLIAVGGGSTAYALSTASTPHSGSVPSAGPTVASSFGGRGFGGGTGGGRGGFGGRTGGTSSRTGGFPGGGTRGEGTAGGFTPPTGGAQGGPGGTGGGTTGGANGATTGGTGGETGSTGRTGTGRAGGGFGGGGGGGTTVSSALVTLLENAGTKWSAATIGSQSAAPLELQSNTAVIAIGGFTGSDDAPTLAQFESYVRAGQIHYFISGAMGGGRGGSGSSAQITAWVEAHYTATTVGGQTVYDLTKATS